MGVLDVTTTNVPILIDTEMDLNRGGERGGKDNTTQAVAIHSNMASPSSSENSRGGISPPRNLHGMKNLSLLNSGKRGRKTDREREESGGRREWSDNEITALISLWRDNDILYDTNHPLYYVQSERKLVMELISKDMNINLRDVNDKMHSLRTYYCSQRQRTESLDAKCGGSSRNFPRWKFYDQMSFLYESVSNRAAKSSLSSTRRGRKPRGDHHERMKPSLSPNESSMQHQQIPYTMMHLQTPSHNYSPPPAATSSTSGSSNNLNDEYPLATSNSQQHQPQPQPKEEERRSPLHDDERYELGMNEPQYNHHHHHHQNTNQLQQSTTSGYLHQTEDHAGSPLENSGARKRHRSDDIWQDQPSQPQQQHYSNQSSNHSNHSGHAQSPSSLSSRTHINSFKTIEVPLNTADEIFGHMVACSLGQINDDQEKELLKLEIQKLIYNTRFRTCNGN